MQIILKTTYAGPDGTIQPGQTVTRPEDDAQQMIDHGYAVRPYVAERVRTSRPPRSPRRKPPPPPPDDAEDDVAEDEAAAG